MDDPGIAEHVEMARRNGEINGAASGHFSHPARPPTAGQPGKEGDAVGVAERFEESRRENTGEVAAGGGLGGWGSLLAHLRHYASIAT